MRNSARGGKGRDELRRLCVIGDGPESKGCEASPRLVYEVSQGEAVLKPTSLLPRLLITMAEAMWNEVKV